MRYLREGCLMAGKRGKNKLTDAIRAEIVVRHASYESATAIQAWLRDEHGIEVGLSGLAYYDFDNPVRRRDSKARKWLKLFDEAREECNREIQRIPVANPAYRLRIVQKRLDAHLASGKGGRVNDQVVKELLELAAKDAGGAFTNRRVVDLNPRAALAQLLGVSEEEVPDGEADA